MSSVKNRIRLILLLIMAIAWGMILLSLSTISRMMGIIDVIVSQDAEVAGLGDRINVGMLDARQDERKFITFYDSTYLIQNRARMDAIIEDIHIVEAHFEIYRQDLDSVLFMIDRYNVQVNRLFRLFKENPRALYRLQEQMREYEIEFNRLAYRQNPDFQDVPGSPSDIRLPIRSGSLQVSPEQIVLFSNLRETGEQIQRLSYKISSRARASLSRNSTLSVQYGLRTQKWIFMIFIVSGLVLLFFIVVIPKRLVNRLTRLNKMLQAISRGDTEVHIPGSRIGDEIDELSGSFREAIEQLKYFNDLKTERIIEIERNLRRIIDEVEEAVFILSEELKITHVNRAAQNLFEINTSVIRTSIKTIVPVWESLGETLSRIEKTGRFDEMVRIRGRKLKKHHVTIMPIMGLRNRLESVVIFIR